MNMSILNQIASSSGAFVVGDQKVCALHIESYKVLRQTLWNLIQAGTYNGATP